MSNDKEIEIRNGLTIANRYRKKVEIKRTRNIHNSLNRMFCETRILLKIFTISRIKEIPVNLIAVMGVNREINGTSKMWKPRDRSAGS